MIAKIKINGEEIKIRQAVKCGYTTLPLDGGIADLSFPKSKLRRARTQGEPLGSICNALTCGGITGLYIFEPIEKEKKMAELLNKIADEVFNRLRHTFRIRKLLPEETFILQGMTIEDCLKARAIGVSNSQLYKQAGNGLSSNVVMLLGEHLKKMYKPDFETTDEKMVKIYGEVK